MMRSAEPTLLAGYDVDLAAQSIRLTNRCATH